MTTSDFFVLREVYQKHIDFWFVEVQYKGGRNTIGMGASKEEALEEAKMKILIWVLSA